MIAPTLSVVGTNTVDQRTVDQWTNTQWASATMLGSGQCNSRWPHSGPVYIGWCTAEPNCEPVYIGLHSGPTHSGPARMPDALPYQRACTPDPFLS